MGDGFTPIRNKCTWWRERDVDEDVYDVRVPEHEKRVTCSCFVEGHVWTVARADVPDDCPEARRCRYHIRHW